MTDLFNNNCDQQSITEYYEEYDREYKKALVNLEKNNSKTKDLIIDSYRNSTENGNRIQHAVTLSKLRAYIAILQKLNQDISTVDQTQNLTVTSTTVHPLDITSDEIDKGIIESEPLLPKPKCDTVEIQAKIRQNSLIDHEHPGKHFNYPQPEIHLYSRNHKGICVISHVRKCEDKKSFFIVDNSMIKGMHTHTDALRKLVQLSFELKIKPNWIPGGDDVFGIFIETDFFRAVKQSKAEPNDQTFKILLIDTGEIMDIDIRNDELYDLPKDIRVMPALALYCILDKKSTTTMGFIKDKLYKETTFRITKIKKFTFHLDDIKGITNPFYAELVNEQLNSSKMFDPNITNRRKYKAEYSSASDDLTLSDSDASNTTVSNKELSTKKGEVVSEPVFTETKSTSNAIEAVMTFRPTDDQRLCHFYNYRTQSCFKGPNCKLQHLPQVEGGWSRDKVETKTAIPAELEYPSVNSMIRIIPTSLENDGSFWSLIECDGRSDPLLKLQQLTQQLNLPEYTKNYKELDHFPVFSELVLAQYRDNMWYRAKVIGDYDDRFNVFYVDYGNTSLISLNKIRKWDNRCDYLPFQAIKCHIANVLIKQENHKQKLDILGKLILDRRMTAIVLNNINDLELLLMDPDGEDVGDQLVQQNCATYRKLITPNLGGNCNLLPQ